MPASPRITLLLFAFNQIELVEAAVRACFAQEGESLDILLSDDASTDGTWESLQTLAAGYRGPHQVRTRRNAVNLGVGAHYNAAVADCVGQLVVTAAGDDISLPHRVRTLAAAWDATGCRADLIASHLIDMDTTGCDRGVIRVDDLSHWRSASDWLNKRPYVVGASHAFTRRLFDRFGPIRADLPYEDQVMALRAACMGGGVTVNEPLLRYRRGGLSAATKQAADPAAHRQRLVTKHTRQLALARQVRQDLQQAGLTGLWGGGMARKLHQSEFMLALCRTETWRERRALAGSASNVSPLWAWAQTLNMQWTASRLGWRGKPTSD